RGVQGQKPYSLNPDKPNISPKRRVILNNGREQFENSRLSRGTGANSVRAEDI
ncbi:MAG: hypothetical protein ACI90V_005623, partial [Bacillariaceae sp.]